MMVNTPSHCNDVLAVVCSTLSHLGPFAVKDSFGNQKLPKNMASGCDLSSDAVRTAGT